MRVEHAVNEASLAPFASNTRSLYLNIPVDQVFTLIIEISNGIG